MGKLCVGLGCVGVFFCLIPLVLYGIFNTGVAALGALSAALILLPLFWNRGLAAYPRLRGAMVVMVCVFLAYALVISALMARRAWFSQPPEEGEVTVIVLGSKINGDQPSLMLRRRLDAAATYMDKNPDATCIVSGGQGSDEQYPEALVMQNYLVRIGVPQERIFMEDKSTNTRLNLRLSRLLMENPQQPVVIATDGFHQLRASVFAEAEGLDNTYNISSSTPWGLLPSYWIRDILGVTWAWASIHLLGMA